MTHAPESDPNKIVSQGVPECHPDPENPSAWPVGPRKPIGGKMYRDDDDYEDFYQDRDDPYDGHDDDDETSDGYGNVLSGRYDAPEVQS